jgi:acetolactate synthase-1/2/3 large subunit
MGTITAGELLVRCLRAEGIELATGIIDGAHIPIVVHLPKYGIRYVNARHEEAAVHVAEGYTRIARRPAVVLGNPGCGTGNMLAGVMSAFAEGHPVLALGTLRPRLRSDPARAGAWQAADTESMARPIVKFAATVRQWERLPELVRAAFRAMTSGRPGPAYLAIPDELLAQKLDEGALPPVYPAARYRVTSLGAGDAAALERAADLLAGAERPYLHAGKGVLWADAGAELVALGEHLGAGMSASLGARGVVPEDHPHYFHPFDLGGAGLARADADVVLVAGARLGEYDGYGLPPLWGDPATQTTIQLDADPLSIGANRPVDLALVADAKPALAALLAGVRARSKQRAEVPGLARYRAESAKTMQQGIAYLGQPCSSGVNPGRMVMAVRQLFPPDAITVLDGGNTTLTGVAFHPILSAPSFLYSVKMGYLGTGVPFALGAKLAAPDRPVCVISGDGAFGFHAMELETAAREELPIVVVIAVDAAWGMEKTAFVAQGYGAADWERRGIDLAEVRYDDLARSLGCHGERVERLEELTPALERARAARRPAVVHVEVDRELNTKPPGWEQFRKARSVQGY